MISTKDVEYIAKLARIELIDKEKEKLAQEMSSILGYIDKLNEVDVSGIEPTAQVTGLENIFRPDQLRDDYKLQTTNYKLLIDAMPKRERNYLKVKAVFKKP